MRRRVQIEADSTVLTYSYLRAASINALDYAKSSNEGSFFNCMTAMVFSAFCIEAYLNHLGQKKLNYWTMIEKGLSPREKLLVLTDVIEYPPDFAQRPFQTFAEIFRFRDMLAHGKTERVKKTFVEKLLDGERPELPQAKWQETCSLDTAIRFCDDTRVMIEELHRQAGYAEHPFWSLGTGAWKMGSADESGISSDKQ